MAKVLAERPSDGVALLKLNHPEKRNALSLDIRDEIADLIDGYVTDDSVRCIVITGDEKFFAAGADLAELAERTPNDPAFNRSRRCWRSMVNCHKPLIAAIRGYAFGGGFELAMHCDIIIVGENAKIGQPEVKVGVMPGAGGTQRFARATGKYRAMRWLLTGDAISGRDAYGMGLASEVVPDDQVVKHAVDVAGKIAAQAPLAVAAIKEVVLAGADASLDTALRLERKAFELLFATEDRTEGIKAFFEKRSPQFKGR
jgi:enoyl-CoA hydratase/carnithine racemase